MAGPSAAQASGERGLLALAGVCAGLLFVALALPLLRWEIYLDSDLRDFYVPVRFFYQNALQGGSEFLWFPYEFAGFYLHGEGQAGLYHPLNLLSYRWLPLTLAWNLELLRSYAFAWLGGFLLLRRLGLPASAALLGGTLYAFSPFHLLHYMHPSVVAATAHLPWLLLALERLARAATPLARALAAALFALLSASQLLLGHPQAVWMSLIVEGLFTLWLWRGGAGAGVCARAAAAKLLGALCAAIQLLPTWDALQHSTRAEPPEGFRESFALAPLDLVQLFQPYLFTQRVVGKSTHELVIYAGAFGVLALLWLALARPAAGAPRRLGRAALALAPLGVLLALGPTGVLYTALTSVPVIGLFRAPARYGFFLHTASALAAALLFAELLRRPRAAPSANEWVLAICVPLASAAFAGLLFIAPGATSGLAPAAAGFALFAATGLLFALAAAGRRRALAALLALACIDVGVYGMSYIGERTPAPESFESLYAATEPPDQPPGYRALVGPAARTMRGVRYLWGYVALWPKRELPVLSDGGGGPYGPGRALWRSAMRVASVAIDPAAPPLPRARLLTQARVSQRPADDLLAIDVATTALVPQALELDPGPPGEAAILEDAAGEIALATDAPGRQLLVVSEAHHPGWRVWIDGAPAAPLRVYGDYLGVVVPAGAHRVRWHFEPQSFTWGARLSGLGLAGVGAWLAFALASRSRAAPQKR